MTFSPIWFKKHNTSIQCALKKKNTKHIEMNWELMHQRNSRSWERLLQLIDAEPWSQTMQDTEWKFMNTHVTKPEKGYFPNYSCSFIEGQHKVNGTLEERARFTDYAERLINPKSDLPFVIWSLRLSALKLLPPTEPSVCIQAAYWNVKCYEGKKFGKDSILILSIKIIRDLRRSYICGR